MNDTLAYTIFGIVIAGLFAYILYREKNRAGQSDVSQNVLDELLRMKQELHQKSTEQKAEVQNRLDRVHDQLSRGMEHSQNSMQKQHTESQRTIQNISERLVELTKTNEKVSGFAEQLQELQHILKNPKQRGVLGEYWLETLLSNVLPNHKEMYKLQYLVGEDEKTGQKLIVDAAIFINE